jgi:hypothetical protein
MYSFNLINYRSLLEANVKNEKMIDRRGFLKMGMKASGSVLALSAIPIHLMAQDHVTEDEALAKAMGYVLDATTTDTAKFPKRAGDAGASQFCNNCALYAGEADSEFAPCSIFQNRNVAGKGWCNAWVAKA